MSSHRVRPGSSIAELLQALSAPAAKTKPNPANQGAPVRPRAGAHDPAALRYELALLATDADLDSEPAVRALRRPVVRRILLWEFGESFLEHPDFPGALASIESAIEADPAVQGRFVDMLKQVRG